MILRSNRKKKTENFAPIKLRMKKKKEKKRERLLSNYVFAGISYTNRYSSSRFGFFYLINCHIHYGVFQKILLLHLQ
ncbi:hypothetical protein CICLE_v10004092mg [Citrus x clementina]|uniref:Uncharacterized protein n=1 Tax=Citrus clementina TaxID=85681 RepID=V4V940_CITCL|nr:hypothetical protein CICLE_v10004092mg [Citrus x clementina]